MVKSSTIKTIIANCIIFTNLTGSVTVLQTFFVAVFAVRRELLLVKGILLLNAVLTSVVEGKHTLAAVLAVV